MDDKTRAKLFESVVEGLMPQHPKPPEDLGWQIISAIAATLSEEHRNQFNGAVRETEFLFTSGTFSTAEFLQSLARALRQIAARPASPTDYFLLVDGKRYRLIRWDSNESFSFAVSTSTLYSANMDLVKTLTTIMSIEIDCPEGEKEELNSLLMAQNPQFVNPSGEIVKSRGFVRSIRRLDKQRVLVEVVA